MEKIPIICTLLLTVCILGASAAATDTKNSARSMNKETHQNENIKVGNKSQKKVAPTGLRLAVSDLPNPISRHCQNYSKVCHPRVSDTQKYCILMMKNGCCCKTWREGREFCTKPCTCPPPCPTPDPRQNSKYAWVSGDPHFMTYDGLTYDCQACGEFVLSTKPDCPKYEIQGRFYISEATPTVSTVSDAVFMHEGAPTIQVGYVRKLSTPHRDYGINACNVAFYVDGVNNQISPGTTRIFSAATVVTTNDRVTVTMPSGMTMVFYMWYWGGRCVALVTHNLPNTVSHGGIMGLFGSPQTAPDMWNDWMDDDGNLITVPTNWWDRNVAGTPYCKTNWKVTNPSSSYFTYEAGTTQPDIAACVAGDWNGSSARLLMPKDASLLGDKELADDSVKLDRMVDPDVAPGDGKDEEELREICGEMLDCLMDGRLGGVEGARAFKISEAKASESFRVFASGKTAPAK